MNLRKNSAISFHRKLNYFRCRMLNKINISEIIIGHLDTLIDASSGERSTKDLVLFYVIPVVIAVIFCFFSPVMESGAADTLVNAGAIFTGLLLSLLMLVYDHKSRLKDDNTDQGVRLKSVFHELYYNISYAVVMSVFIVFSSFLHKVLYSVDSVISGITGALLIFIGLNLLLTILMILKRISIILTMD